MRRRRLAGLAAAVAVALVAWAGVALFETVETEVDVGFQGEARRDPLLAARRLLGALGVPAKSRQGLHPLPPPDHVLLLLAPEGSLSGPDHRRLLAWIAAGGHLVATPQGPLLREVGAEVEELENEGDGGDEGDEGDDALEVEADRGRSYLVAIAGRRRLADPEERADFAAGPEQGRVLLRYRRGAGRLTLLSEARFLTNREIGRHEHASFLWALASAGGRPAGALLVGHFLRPGLAAVVARRGAPALAAGGALLLLWAWRRAARFGPLLPDPPASRRSLVEHVRAVGDFLWRQGREGDLLASARRGLERSAARLHPGWQGLAQRERFDRLARAAGLASGAVEWALAGEAPRDPASFARMVGILEQVRRAL